MLESAMKAGTAGLSTGRRAWQREHPDRLLIDQSGTGTRRVRRRLDINNCCLYNIEIQQG